MMTEPVEDFVLTSSQNLRIAGAVFEAWPRIRHKIAIGFLNRLRERLKKELKSWEFQVDEVDDRYFEEPWSTFFLWKPNWKNHSVGLQFAAYGEKMQFGVYRDKVIHGKPYCGELVEKLKEIDPSARTNNCWEGVTAMRSPAADWRSPEVLWRMHTDKKFLEDVARQLLEVAKASELILDRLARQK